MDEDFNPLASIESVNDHNVLEVVQPFLPSVRAVWDASFMALWEL